MKNTHSQHTFIKLNYNKLQIYTVFILLMNSNSIHTHPNWINILTILRRESKMKEWNKPECEIANASEQVGPVFLEKEQNDRNVLQP